MGQHFFHPFQLLEFSLRDTLVCLIYCLFILYFIIGIIEVMVINRILIQFK